MNIENFQAMMDALTQLGDNAHTAFVWWLALGKALPTLAATAFGITFLYTCWVLGKGLLRNQEYEVALMEIRDAMGIGTLGYLSDYELSEIKKAAHGYRTLRGDLITLSSHILQQGIQSSGDVDMDTLIKELGRLHTNDIKYGALNAKD